LTEEEVQILEKTVKNVNALFQHSNTTSYLETLTAQQSLLSAQLQLINDNYNKVQAAITLYQALGGGWQ
jgi:outer membrane protein TolC